MSPKLRAWMINLTLLSFVLAVSLVAAEMGFRYYKHKIAPNPTGGLVVKDYTITGPNAKGTIYHFDDGMALKSKVKVQYNNWGDRFYKDYSPVKLPGEFRIAVMGSSLTAGVTNDFPWVQVMDQVLQDNAALRKNLGATKITVANFAGAGSKVQHMAGKLKRIGELYKPDLIIFAVADENFTASPNWRNELSNARTFRMVEELQKTLIDREDPKRLIAIPAAPEFFLYRNPNGSISRQITYRGHDKEFYHDKDVLRALQDAQVETLVYDGRIWLREELKKLVTRAKAQAVPEQQDAAQQKEEALAAAAEAFRIAQDTAPVTLFIVLPTYYEVLDPLNGLRPGKAFTYWPEFLQKHPEIPAISLKDHLPIEKTSFEEKLSWFLLPNDGHLSDKGTTMVGERITALLTRYLEGDRSMLVTPKVVAGEIARKKAEEQREADEKMAHELLLQAHKAHKTDLDQAIELISQAIEKSDAIGTPGIIYVERANMWIEKQEYDKAFADLSKAKEQNPTPPVLQAYIQTALQLKKNDEVEQALQLLQEKGKDDASVQAFIESIRKSQGKNVH